MVSKSIFDRIGSLIPGYIGYDDREGRRDCDKQLRRNISFLIEDINQLIYSKIEKLDLESKNLVSLKSYDDLRKRVITFKDKLVYSPSGVSSFFSKKKISSKELDIIYDIDLNIISLIVDLKKSIEKDDLITGKELLEKCFSLFNERSRFLIQFN